jgi:hypothetical protein
MSVFSRLLDFEALRRGMRAENRAHFSSSRSSPDLRKSETALPDAFAVLLHGTEQVARRKTDAPNGFKKSPKVSA